jgi:hypothetical protein
MSLRGGCTTCLLFSMVGTPVFTLPRILTQLCVTLKQAFYKQCVYQLGEVEGVP